MVMRHLGFGLVLAAGMALATGSALAQGAPGVTKDTIKIGTYGPLTGPVFIYGKMVMNGVEVVFDEINAAGGIHGRKLQFVREDDRCDPATAIGAVKKLVHQEQVFAIIGGGCSNAALATRDEVIKEKVPMVIFAAVHDGITQPTAPNIFTTALTASVESFAQLEFAIQQKAQKIAILSMRDSWGRSRYEPLLEAFKKKNMKPVADEELAPDANDATAQVLRLRAAGADAVIMILYPKPGAVFLRDAQKLGYKPIAVGQTAITDLVAFEEQVGVPGATANFFTISQVKTVPEDPAMDKWRKAIETKFPGDRLSIFNLFGIGSGQVFAEALRRSGADITREKFQQAMVGINNFVTDTYSGPISCAPGDHQCHKSPAWIKREADGKIKVLGITTVTR
ncbi:MAG: hypothetical protein FJX52_14750 [Alphaproteobacteria bacterium]|nr:hypothetical protein [Alphaproteobacteria bacterium]